MTIAPAKAAPTAQLPWDPQLLLPAESVGIEPGVDVAAGVPIGVPGVEAPGTTIGGTLETNVTELSELEALVADVSAEEETVDEDVPAEVEDWVSAAEELETELVWDLTPNPTRALS